MPRNLSWLDGSAMSDYFLNADIHKADTTPELFAELYDEHVG